MKRILVTASHHKMADGLKDTLNFVSGGVQETIALSAIWITSGGRGSR